MKDKYRHQLWLMAYERAFFQEFNAESFPNTHGVEFIAQKAARYAELVCQDAGKYCPIYMQEDEHE